MLHEASRKASEMNTCTADMLYDIYKRKFPTAAIPTRPGRLLEAAKRIASPFEDDSVKTRHGHSNEKKDSVQSSNYLDKLYIPILRNKSG